MEGCSIPGRLITKSKNRFFYYQEVGPAELPDLQPISETQAPCFPAGGGVGMAGVTGGAEARGQYLFPLLLGDRNS